MGKSWVIYAFSDFCSTFSLLNIRNTTEYFVAYSKHGEITMQNHFVGCFGFWFVGQVALLNNNLYLEHDNKKIVATFQNKWRHELKRIRRVDLLILKIIAVCVCSVHSLRWIVGHVGYMFRLYLQRSTNRQSFHMLSSTNIGLKRVRLQCFQPIQYVDRTELIITQNFSIVGHNCSIQ